MGYVMYVDGDLTISRELTKDEQEMILEEYDFNEPIDIDEDEIYLYTEYGGLCPDQYLSEDIDLLIDIGKEIGFTINGELTLDMTMGCCGRQRWKIDNNDIEVVESESDFLEDYTDKQLIDELKRRGYIDVVPIDVLDKIRAEIEAKIVRRPWLDFEDRERDRNDAFLEVLDIIDKYKAEINTVLKER